MADFKNSIIVFANSFRAHFKPVSNAVVYAKHAFMEQHDKAMTRIHAYLNASEKPEQRPGLLAARKTLPNQVKDSWQSFRSDWKNRTNAEDKHRNKQAVLRGKANEVAGSVKSRKARLEKIVSRGDIISKEDEAFLERVKKPIGLNAEIARERDAVRKEIAGDKASFRRYIDAKGSPCVCLLKRLDIIGNSGIDAVQNSIVNVAKIVQHKFNRGTQLDGLIDAVALHYGKAVLQVVAHAGVGAFQGGIAEPMRQAIKDVTQYSNTGRPQAQNNGGPTRAHWRRP